MDQAVVILGNRADWRAAGTVFETLGRIGIKAAVKDVDDINNVLHHPEGSCIVVMINACRSWHTVTQLLRANLPIVPVETEYTEFKIIGPNRNPLFHESLSVDDPPDKFRQAIQKVSLTVQTTLPL